MKLSQENIKALSNCAENKVRLIVTGKNGFGQEFSTEGYILSGIDVKGQPKWVSDRGFGLFVGQTRKDNMGEDFKLFVPIISSALSAKSIIVFLQSINLPVYGIFSPYGPQLIAEYFSYTLFPNSKATNTGIVCFSSGIDIVLGPSSSLEHNNLGLL